MKCDRINAARVTTGIAMPEKNLPEVSDVERTFFCQPWDRTGN
jgi:hypothetical protein